MKNRKMSDLNHLVKLSNSLQDLMNLNWQLNRSEVLYCINSRNWFHLKKEEIIIMYRRISSVKFVRITKKMREDIIFIWFYVILRILSLPTLVSGPKILYFWSVNTQYWPILNWCFKYFLFSILICTKSWNYCQLMFEK